MQREMLDVMVEVSFPKRRYRGKRTTHRRTFRLVAVRNKIANKYHCYFTNIPADRVPAVEIRSTYALRWQVELLFKAMKTHGHLAHLPSSKQYIVESLIWASVLATIASQALYREVRRRVAADRHMPLLRWAAIFARAATELLKLVIETNLDAGSLIMATFVSEAPDPNVKRRKRAFDAVPYLI